MALSEEEQVYNEALGYIGEYRVIEGATTTKQYEFCSRYYDKARDMTLASHPWNEAKKMVIIVQNATDPIAWYEKRYSKPSDHIRTLSVDNSVGADVSRRTAGVYPWEVVGDYILSNAGATPDTWSSGKDYIDGQFFSYSSTTYEVLVTHTSDITGGDAAAQIAVDVAAGNIESKGGDYRIVYVEYIWQLTDITKFSPHLKEAVGIQLAIKVISGLTNDTKGKIDLINEFERLTSPKARSIDAMQMKPKPIFSSEWIRSRRVGTGGWYVT